MKWGFGGLVEFLEAVADCCNKLGLGAGTLRFAVVGAYGCAGTQDLAPEHTRLVRLGPWAGSAENRRITRWANAFVRYRKFGTSSLILQLTDCSSQAFVQRPKPRAGEFCGNEKLDVGPTNTACVELVAFEKLQAFFEGAGLRSGKQA